MFCSKCGEMIPDDAAFCPKCGSPVGGSPVNSAPPTIDQRIYVDVNYNNISPKSRTLAAVLCFFLGGLGIHRFYVGKVGTGILWMVTLGLFGFGALVDFIVILCGGFKDSYGRPVKEW